MPDPATVGSLLKWARHQNLPHREAVALLAEATDHTHAWVLAHPEAHLDAESLRHWQDLASRRVREEPLAYVLGHREFWSLDLRVSPAVLIPRIETESLVQAVLDQMAGMTSPAVVDLGTGSGAIIIALGKERPDAQLIATDISTKALAVARENARHHDVEVDWRQGDWLEALGDDRVDVIVSNPPYIEPDDPHLRQGDLRFEPASALVAEHGGFAAYQQIVLNARRHLHKGGLLALEHGASQRTALADLLREAQFRDIQTFDDDFDNARVICARV